MHQRDFGASFLRPSTTGAPHYLQPDRSAQGPKLDHLLFKFGGEICEVGNSFSRQ